MLKISKSFLILYLSVFVLFSVISHMAWATIVETQSLSFGTFALTDNDAMHDLLVQPNGTILADPEFAIVVDGQQATYDVSAFPATTTLIISVTSGQLSFGGSGGGELFNVVNYQHSPVSPVTDVLGNASFSVGATLRTSGSTSMYIEGGFSAPGTVTVNF